MRTLYTTILLSVTAAAAVTASAFLAVDGNLARLTGWYHFRPGMPLFTKENMATLPKVNWMRIRDLNDYIECAREADGSWWIVKPFRDRMSRHAAESILQFTEQAKLVDTVPMNRHTRGSLREFGVESSPHAITLKVSTPDGDSTVARYTLGSTSPWLEDGGDGETLHPTTYLRTDFYGRDKRVHVVSGNILPLFKNGLYALREPHLLCLPDSIVVPSPDGRNVTLSPEEMISGISIETADGTRTELERELSFRTKEDGKQELTAHWRITAPLPLEVNHDRVQALTAALVKLTGLKTEDRAGITLPEKPVYKLTVQTLAPSQEKVEICIYPPFTAPGEDRQLCYATVSGRPVVFTLAAERLADRQGSYSPLVRSVLHAPVLPAKSLAHLQSLDAVQYVSEIPLSTDKLRSMELTTLPLADVERIYLRSRRGGDSVALLCIPGSREGEVADVWKYSANRAPFATAEADVVTRFLKGMRDIPVDGVEADARTPEEMQELVNRYGLNRPDYVIQLLPKGCPVRASLFGRDLPIIKDRSPLVYYLNRYRDPVEGKARWLACADGGRSIYRLSTRFTKLCSVEPLVWKQRNLFHFPGSALRHLTLGFRRAPLSLDYDYQIESWSGKLGDRDVTPNINPNLANYYVRHLQKMKVKSWVDPEDPDALEALRTPAFTVKVDLELTDFSDTDSVIDTPTEANEVTGEGEVTKPVEDMLSGNDAADAEFRKLISEQRRTYAKTITLEIAPAEPENPRSIFYGRLRETGELFVLSNEDAQSLGATPLEGL